MTSDKTIPRLFFRLPLDPARLLRARQRVRDYLYEGGAGSEDVESIVLSLEEAMTNAVRHSEADQDLEVSLWAEGPDLVAEVRDCGRGFEVASFDPGQTPDPLSPGRRGLFLMSQLMDDLQLRCDGGLEVRVVKRDVLPSNGKWTEARSLEAMVPGSQAYRDERQRAFLDEIGEGFAALDWEYRFLHVNAAIERFLGRPPSGLVGHTLWELLAYAAAHPAIKPYREAMELGRASVVEYESPAAGCWIEARTYPTSSGIAIYFRDIDERKRKELERDEYYEALGESEERFRSVSDQMSEGLMLFDADRKLIYQNPAAALLHGYRLDREGHVESEELAATWEGWDEQGRRMAFDEWPLSRVVRGESFQDLVLRARRIETGREFWGSYNGSPIYGPDGQFLLGFITIRDITERRQAEAKLKDDLAALTVMHDLSGRLVEGAEMQPILQDVMDAAVAIVDAQFGTLQLLEGDSLRIVAHHHHQQAFLDFFEAAENTASVCGEATRRGERVVVEDVETDPLFVGTPSLDVLRRAGVRAVQSTPLMSRGGELLGILTTQWREPYRPDDHDLWRIDLLARQASDLIETARSKEALRESNERYRRIVELADEDLAVHADGTYSVQEADSTPAEADPRRQAFRGHVLDIGQVLRRHRLSTLLLAVGLELAFLVPMGLAPTSRHVLGMPGSLLALTVILTAAVVGWEVGVAAALAGGIVFWATVADFGAQSALITTVISTGIWVAAALLSGLLADALRDQTRKRKSAAVALARAETQRQVQAGEQERVERLASDLRREREQLRGIVEQADMSIVFLDCDFNFLLVNSTYATTCGYEPDEMVGLNHFDLYPHEENEAIFRQVRDTGEAVEYLAKPFEFPDQPERGVTYWDWRLAPLKDDEGRVEALVFSLVEVTERVRSGMFADALNAINATIAARLDEEHILATVPQMAGEALGCDAGNVGMRYGESWLPTRGWNISEEFLAERFISADVPWAELAIAEQRPVLLEDFARDPLGDAALAETYGFGAVAVLPMLVNGRGIGCLFFTYRKTHHFSHLEVDFAEKVAALLSQALENARLLRDTQRVATMLQENLIHPLPSLEGVELGRVAKPAYAPDLVGGDFSDVMLLDDVHVALLIGDVAGKGIKAAGLTETVRTAVFAYLASDASPASALGKTNRLLLKTLPPEATFVTACLAIVDLTSKTVRVASAGHPPPMVVSSSCAPLELTFGLPLGAFEYGYEEHEVTLSSDDFLVFYTDGVTEARHARELFGEARIAEALCSRDGDGAQEVAELVRDAATQFAGELRDDLEVLVLRLS